MTSKEEIQDEVPTDQIQSTASIVEDFSFEPRMSRVINPSSNSSYTPKRRREMFREEQEEQNPIHPDEFIKRMKEGFGGLRGGAPLKRPDFTFRELPLRVKMALWFRDNYQSVLFGALAGTLIYLGYRYISSDSIKKIEENASLSEDIQ